MSARSWLPLVFCGLLSGCASGPQPGSASAGQSGSAIVVQGDDLAGNLLDGLRTRIPTMTVTHPSGECPRIIFRGQRSMRNQGNPSVYVDGTHMNDTCVLTQLSTTDIDRIVVYTGGSSSPAGLPRNPFGLILVYRVGRER